MAEFRILDEAHLFRIEICGRLAGEIVDQVRDCWQTALSNDASRLLTIDLSHMTGYDVSGFRLLRELQEHGTYLAARNPEALAFLSEISSPEGVGPKLVYRASGSEGVRKRVGKANVRQISRAAGAS